MLRLVTLHFTNVTFYPQEGHNCRIKKYNFVNINSADTIVSNFYMLLLFIIKQFQNSASWCVKVGVEVMYIFKL